MAKPKNDGQMLQVRISAAAHSDLNLCLAKWAASTAPVRRTKGYVVEEALKAYRKFLYGEEVEYAVNTSSKV